MVCLGLWLTISVKLDDPRKYNPKPLHNHPNSCAPLACCLQLMLTQASVEAFEITLVSQALGGLENLELLGFQGRKMKIFISVF